MGDSDAGMGAGPVPSTRLPVAIVVVAAAIVVVAVGVIATSGRGSAKHVLVSQGTSTTAATTTTLGITPGPPGTTPATVTTTTATTVVAPATTMAPPTTAAPTTTVARAECRTNQLLVTTTTDRNTYPKGQPVTITVTITKLGAGRCQIANPLPSPFDPAPVVITSGGKVVWQPAPTGNGVVVPPTPEVLGAGASYTWTTVVWNQDRCVAPCTNNTTPTAMASAGVYQAQPRGAPGQGGPAPFMIG